MESRLTFTYGEAGDIKLSKDNNRDKFLRESGKRVMECHIIKFFSPGRPDLWTCNVAFSE